jgi:hypothetical protein
MLPLQVEGGPGVDRYAGWTPSYVDSGLVYYHLMFLWLQFEGLGWVYFKTTTEEIELFAERPHPAGWSDPYFLDSEGWWVPATCVGALHAPAALAALVGATVTEITPLYYDYPRPARARRWWQQARQVDEKDDAYIETGLIIEATAGTVAIADAGDEYAVGEWPDKERWEALNVVTDVDPRRVPPPRTW